MRDIRFRYMISCELIDKENNVIKEYIAPTYLMLKEIEEVKILKEYKLKDGNILKIRDIIARDMFTGYIDVDSEEIFENDKCINQMDERIGYIMFIKGQWVFEIEADSMNTVGKVENIPLESCHWIIRKIGTRYGNDNKGELRKYSIGDWEEIV